MTEIVRETHVKHDDVDLTVSTIKIGFRRYDTVVFDNHTDRRHAGKRLPGHESEGRSYGPYVIDALNIPANTREEALNDHREAMFAARTDTPA